jgi:glutamyl-tRNA reductase
MGRLCVVSMDHNSSTVETRAAFSERAAAYVDVIRLGGGVEYLKLETCNRIELYLVFGDDRDEREAISSMTVEGAAALFGYDAVRRLLRVLLGLESMAKGESHIVSQVKAAYGKSDGCGKVLHRLFQRAFGVAASLRSGCHPGREPSIPYIAAKHYAENAVSASAPVMVVGMGEVGLETARVLILMGCRVLVSNRTERPPGAGISDAETVPWGEWRERARECGAVFLCTSSPVPILSGETQDAMPGVWTMDLGAPHQSAPRSRGVRVTLDDMKTISEVMTREYAKSLSVLEAEADRASAALLAEISVLTDDTWKHLALARARAIIKERAAQQAHRLGCGEEELEAFASSVMNAFLHPLVAARAAHSSRAWRILSGEGKEE